MYLNNTIEYSIFPQARGRDSPVSDFCIYYLTKIGNIIICDENLDYMGKSAARVGDSVADPLPPVLTGMGSLHVFIGKKPVWKGIPAAGIPGLHTAKRLVMVS